MDVAKQMMVEFLRTRSPGQWTVLMVFLVLSALLVDREFNRAGMVGACLLGALYGGLFVCGAWVGRKTSPSDANPKGGDAQ